LITIKGSEANKSSVYSLFFFFCFCYATTKKMEKNAIHAKKENYMVLPGPPGPPGQKVLGPGT
jgi:hypothetical protein